MRLSLFIAYRYLFSKKKINAINIINAIAMLGFGVGAFAMIVILSAFNGFETLVEGLINSYDPDIKISAKHKKVFERDEALNEKILAFDEVLGLSEVLEEKVVIKFNDRQEIARIKGVDRNYNSSGFDSLMVLGTFDLGDTSDFAAVFGAGLAGKLGIFPGSHSPVTVFVPKRDVEYSSLNPSASLSMSYTRASGLFIVHEEIDNEVFIADKGFAESLLDYKGYSSAIELKLKKSADRDDVKEELVAKLGPSWRIETREEQNELIYKIFRSEKWFTYAVLSLVLLICAFNIFGSLIMLVLDKRRDISILKSMGAAKSTIRRVFIWQGSYIALIGGGVGLGLGILAVWLQDKFGLIELQNSIVDAYPVDMFWGDVLITFLTVLVLGYLISLYPAKRAANTAIEQLN
ncbi:ABC transporter permease [bacterium]|nr:ABC transporter permease [bacterium]